MLKVALRPGERRALRQFGELQRAARHQRRNGGDKRPCSHAHGHGQHDEIPVGGAGREVLGPTGHVALYGLVALVGRKYGGECCDAERLWIGQKRTSAVRH